MNGYHLDDVGKIVLGMDSVIGIGLKEQIFGKPSSLTKLEHDGKIEWPQSLARVFAGFTLQQDCVIAGNTVDFFVEKLYGNFELTKSRQIPNFGVTKNYGGFHSESRVDT